MFLKRSTWWLSLVASCFLVGCGANQSGLLSHDDSHSNSAVWYATALEQGIQELTVARIGDSAVLPKLHQGMIRGVLPLTVRPEASRLTAHIGLAEPIFGAIDFTLQLQVGDNFPVLYKSDMNNELSELSFTVDLAEFIDLSQTIDQVVLLILSFESADNSDGNVPIVHSLLLHN